MQSLPVNEYFRLDALSITMMLLVTYIGTIVILFTKKYFQGDRQYTRTLTLLALLIASVVILVSTDNVFLLLLAWTVSNALLVILMIHKPKWRAALAAGMLTAKSFSFALIFLISGLGLLYWRLHTASIQDILLQSNTSDIYISLALIMILVGAMTQSAIFPFHRWLLSSLNSPTPISAIMHAGLVNGGGFILARFAPLYLAHPMLLELMFAMGILTASLGTAYKLIQHDVKRMLACSTMGQMGFMLAQCGLGLFPAAIAHLVCHGLFKANLFLSVNNTIHESRQTNLTPLSILYMAIAVLCASVAIIPFSLMIDYTWQHQDTRLILIGMTLITSTQLTLSLLTSLTWKNIISSSMVTMTVVSLYGGLIRIIDTAFQSSHLMQPQPLNIVYLIGFLVLMGFWIIGLFKNNLAGMLAENKYYHLLYMKLLNSSQPHPKTITSFRNDYQY